MKKAADFRKQAREALKGRWKHAILAGLVASLLGGTNASIGGGGFSISGSQESWREILESFRGNRELLGIFLIVAGVVLSLGLVIGIAWSLLGMLIRPGYCRFNMELLEGEALPQTNRLFEYFKRYRTILPTGLLQLLYIFLWSLLLVIPGIIAAYAYAMVPYIQAENPEMPARQVLAASKNLMRGNKWRLFCLYFSFFGWVLLSILTLGIGMLWVIPYQSAAEAAFYRELTGQNQRASREEPWEN